MREGGEQYQGKLRLSHGDDQHGAPTREMKRGRGPGVVTPTQRRSDQAFRDAVVGWIGRNGAVGHRKLYAIRENDQTPVRSITRALEAAHVVGVDMGRVRADLHEWVDTVVDEVSGRRPTPPPGPGMRLRAA